MTQSIRVSEIVTNAHTQCRVAMDKETVARYADLIGEAEDWPFPDLKLTYDGETYYLASGFHRLAAAMVQGLPEVPVEIFAGGVVQAFQIGLEDNQGPMSPTQADRRYAAERLLQEDSGLSKHAIAKLCGLTRRTVQRIAADVNGRTHDIDTGTTDQGTYIEGINAADGTDAPGTDAPPPPDRDRRTGGSGASSNQDTAPELLPDHKKELVKVQKAKTVKTAEALMRAFGDLDDLESGEYYNDAISYCRNLVEIAKNWH